MSPRRKPEDTYVAPEPNDIVSFCVVAKPTPAASIDEIRGRVSLSTLKRYVAPEPVRRHVAKQLESLGFEVFGLPSPVVSARGTVQLFQSVFPDARLKKRIRLVGVDLDKQVPAIVLERGAPSPSPHPIDNALLIAIVAPPTYVAALLPPATADLNLRLPGDIALLTGASALHRLATPAGDMATGTGVGVAVLDSGFAPHPYYEKHAYKITRLAAPDTTHPEVDLAQHGTALLAALLACAPDVDAYGIRIGDNLVLAFDLVAQYPGIRVVSVSLADDLAGETVLTDDLLVQRIRILETISAGVTVVVAGGNGEIAFPAMMPEVIAVGGVTIDPNDALLAWNGASSFSSVIFPRDVPDLCALASEMWLPIRDNAGSASWISTVGTSFAAPQVSGVAALLLQKNPALTPDDVKSALAGTAHDITAGHTASGDMAGKGRDRATGAGLVSARQAWNSI